MPQEPLNDVGSVTGKPTLPEILKRIARSLGNDGFTRLQISDAYLNELTSDVSRIRERIDRPNLCYPEPDCGASVQRGLLVLWNLLTGGVFGSVYNIGRCWQMRQGTPCEEFHQVDIAVIGDGASFAEAKGIVVGLAIALGLDSASIVIRPMKLQFLGPVGSVAIKAGRPLSEAASHDAVAVGCAGMLRPELWQAAELDPEQLGLLVCLNVDRLMSTMHLIEP
ncbi:hypothetical protein ES703_62443 [subsurface metagenome]